MKREKSCGALVYRTNNMGHTELLFIKHRRGSHWSFPKGHMEEGETEVQTALREVKEETGLDIALQENFRQSVEFFPKPGVKKQVVYFLGKALNENVVRQEEEIEDTRWVLLDKAQNFVTFRNDKGLIQKAKKYFIKQEQKKKEET